MDTYPVNVASILDVLGATLQVSDVLEIDRLEVGTETYLFTSPARFDISLTNTGTSVIGMGSVIAPITATCSRCLCEFPSQIVGEIDGFYVHPGMDEGLPDEQEIEYIDQEGIVDVLPSVMAALVLDAPFAPLHDEACAGICVTCGADLNEGECGCVDGSHDDHPFAALSELLGKSAETEGS